MASILLDGCAGRIFGPSATLISASRPFPTLLVLSHEFALSFFRSCLAFLRRSRLYLVSSLSLVSPPPVPFSQKQAHEGAPRSLARR
jgi:hypothetical protein